MEFRIYNMHKNLFLPFKELNRFFATESYADVNSFRVNRAMSLYISM